MDGWMFGERTMFLNGCLAAKQPFLNGLLFGETPFFLMDVWLNPFLMDGCLVISTHFFMVKI